MTLAAPSNLHAYLHTLDKKPSRSLSQNFLIDSNIVHNFIEKADLSPDDLVLEIGPGPGVFTQEILNSGARVIAVEKDEAFARGLKEQHRDLESIQVIEADFLELDLNQILPKGKKVKVISNLPFKLTSPILGKLFPLYEQIDSCLFILQKEVADRILAKPKTRAFSTLTLFSHFFTEPSFCFNISPNCFFPKPRVTCSALFFKMQPAPLELSDDFFDFARLAFNQKRKMISSTLPFPSQTIQEALKEIGHSEKARPEELGLNSWIHLFKKLT